MKHNHSKWCRDSDGQCHWEKVSDETWAQVDRIIAAGGWHPDHRYTLVGVAESLDTVMHPDYGLTGREWLATFGTVVHPDGTVTRAEPVPGPDAEPLN